MAKGDHLLHPGFLARSGWAGEAGLARGAQPGFVAADLSMLTLAAKREARAALQASGADLLDAPVSGIPPMVAAKRVSYFVSGAQEAYQHWLREWLSEYEASCRVVLELVRDERR